MKTSPKRSTIVAMTFMLALACACKSVPAQVSVHVLASLVDRHYNHLSSLECQYTEHYTGMGLNRTEDGTLLLKKPGRMRWAYSAPAGKLFILDGKNAYFYTPGDAQAQRISAKQLDDLRSPLRFLLGHTQLEKELDKLTVVESGANSTLTGVPKGMEQRIASLAVTVTTASGTIVRLRLEELDGAVTDFHFTNIKENVPVSDGDFHFTAPAGVTIIDGLPPV